MGRGKDGICARTCGRLSRAVPAGAEQTFSKSERRASRRLSEDSGRMERRIGAASHSSPVRFTLAHMLLHASLVNKG